MKEEQMSSQSIDQSYPNQPQVSEISSKQMASTGMAWACASTVGLYAVLSLLYAVDFQILPTSARLARNPLPCIDRYLIPCLTSSIKISGTIKRFGVDKYSCGTDGKRESLQQQ